MPRFGSSAPLFAVSVAALVFVSCSPPTTGASAGLFISVNPLTITNNGQTTSVNVAAQDAQGNPGTGTVTLSVTSGVLGTTSLTLAAGAAPTTFPCDVSKGSTCGGQVEINGKWARSAAPLAS